MRGIEGETGCSKINKFKHPSHHFPQTHLLLSDYNRGRAGQGRAGVGGGGVSLKGVGILC